MFRNIIFLVSAVSIFSAAAAQQPVTINGTYDKAGDGWVKLYRVETGKLSILASYQADQNRKFGFLFYPSSEGFYVIGTGNEKGATDNYTFYFKGGEQLSISLKQDRYELKGNGNAKENVTMYKWFRLTDSVYQKSVNFSRSLSTYKDFFPQLEKLVADSKLFLKQHAAGSNAFSSRLKELVQMDLLHYSNQFLNTPRTEHPEVSQFSAYYQTVQISELTRSASLFYHYPWGERTLSSMLLTAVRQKGMMPKPGLEGLASFISLVSNDTLKGDLALERMAGIKSYTEYQQYLDRFGKYMLTPAQERLKLKGLQGLDAFKPGNTGYNFSAVNSEGKTIRLSDLTGKLVLVDVWATWCGPCKQEEPHWEKLTERFAGKDIVFAGLSTDENKTAWEKYLQEKNLKGLQLHIGSKNELSAVYKISGIPRYMLFDKAGKIISTDAPRPSNDELISLIEKHLVK